MTRKEKYRVKAVTRRQVLEATVAGSALVAAPAFLRHALAADPIKIGIPTVITGGYAILGSQVQRTCRLVKKMTDAKGGVIGRPIEFLFQDTQGDPAMCVRKSQELVERDNCRILTGVIVSSEAAAMLPKLEEWNAVFLSHGNGDGRLTAELFVPRFFRANTSAPMGARTLALYLKDAPEKKFIAIASDAAWGRSSNAAFEEQIKAVGKDLVDKIYAPVANKDYSTYITKILQSGAQGCYVALQGDEARAFYSQAAQYGLAQRVQFFTEIVAQADIKVLGKDLLGLVGSSRYPVTYDIPENRAFLVRLPGRVQERDPGLDRRRDVSGADDPVRRHRESGFGRADENHPGDGRPGRHQRQRARAHAQVRPPGREPGLRGEGRQERQVRRAGGRDHQDLPARDDDAGLPKRQLSRPVTAGLRAARSCRPLPA